MLLGAVVALVVGFRSSSARVGLRHCGDPDDDDRYRARLRGGAGPVALADRLGGGLPRCSSWSILFFFSANSVKIAAALVSARLPGGAYPPDDLEERSRGARPAHGQGTPFR